MQLRDIGVEAKLVLFAADAMWPPSETPAGGEEGGYRWLGGETEATLLVARSVGGGGQSSVQWAEREAKAFRTAGATSVEIEGREDMRASDLDDLKMRTFWEHASQRGMSFVAFNGFVTKAGHNSERLRRLVIESRFPGDTTFEGEVEIIMSQAGWDVSCERRAAADAWAKRKSCFRRSVCPTLQIGRAHV